MWKYLLVGFDDNTSKFSVEFFNNWNMAKNAMRAQMLDVSDFTDLNELLETLGDNAGISEDGFEGWIRDLHGTNYDWEIIPIKAEVTIDVA